MFSISSEVGVLVGDFISFVGLFIFCRLFL